MPNRGALARARQAVITWDESLRDRELFWSVILPISIAFVASSVSGLLVVYALNAPLLMRSSQETIQSRLAIPTRVEVTSATGLLSPALPVAAPAATPLAIPTSPPIATPVVAPSADVAWLAMLPSLDAAWGTDTPATLVLLNAFHTRFPEFQPAKEKLYAALVASAHDLAEAGASDDAQGQLTLATALLPERLEARALLLAFVATPTSASDVAADAPAGVDNSSTSTDANPP